MNAFNVDAAVGLVLDLKQCIKDEDDPREIERLRSIGQHLERTIAAAVDSAAARLDQVTR